MTPSTPLHYPNFLWLPGYTLCGLQAEPGAMASSIARVTCERCKELLDRLGEIKAIRRRKKRIDP